MQQAVAVSDAYDHAEHPWKYSWANPDDEAKMKTALEAIARKELGLDIPAKPAKPPAKTAKTAVHKKTPLVPLAPPEPAPLTDEQFRVFELAYGSSATLVLTASTPLPPTPCRRSQFFELRRFQRTAAPGHQARQANRKFKHAGSSGQHSGPCQACAQTGSAEVCHDHRAAGSLWRRSGALQNRDRCSASGRQASHETRRRRRRHGRQPRRTAL